jgi:hypothetical protein
MAAIPKGRNRKRGAGSAGSVRAIGEARSSRAVTLPITICDAGRADREERQPIDPERQVRLAIELVALDGGFAILAIGWVADPLDRISAVVVQTGAGGPIDLAAGAELLPPPECYGVFDIPRYQAAKYGFVLVIAGPAKDDDRGLTLEVRLKSGEARRHPVQPTGTAARLGEFLARAPLAYALRVVRRLLTKRHACGPRSRSLPQEVDDLLIAVHQRVDPNRNYGSGGNRATVECYVEGSIRVGTAGIVVTGWILHDDADRLREAALVSLFGTRVCAGSPAAGGGAPGRY